DIALQQRMRDGAQRPTFPSARNGGLGSAFASAGPTIIPRLSVFPHAVIKVACWGDADIYNQPPRLRPGPRGGPSPRWPRERRRGLTMKRWAVAGPANW